MKNIIIIDCKSTGLNFIADISEGYGTGLLITDQFIDKGIMQLCLDDIDGINTEYDYVTINL